YDGRLFMPLDEAAVTRAALEMKAAGLKSVAISAIFSPLDPGHERRAAELVAKVLPDAAITCSSDLGRIGLLERENAGLLNAALADLARDTIAAFEKAIADSGVDAALLITQNDRPQAVPPPDRGPGGRSGRGASPAGLQLRFGRHQLDARRGLPFRAFRRHGDRCRRHHDRCRPAQARLSPGTQ